MKFEALTIKDIAKVLGLSTSTVSRALRDSYEISPETKEKVIRYARENNYRPNPIALSLKEKRSSSIGVLVSEIANSFFSQAINGIESVAQEWGYNVVIAQSKEDLNRETSALQYLASRSVDGILVSVSAQTENFDHIQQLYSRGMPMVCFDRVVDFGGIHKVMVNNFRGAFEATQHLLTAGITRIACVASSKFLSISLERVDGFQKALAQAGIAFGYPIEHCAHGGMLYNEVAEAMDKLLAHPQPPTAILACSDKITTNIMRYCQQKNIRIPDQLALIGFSNLDLTELLSPSLSVVRQPAMDMGQKAAELLLQLIESKRPPQQFQEVILPPEIIVRQSSLLKQV